MSDAINRSIESVAVLGLGKIGLLAAELLADCGFTVSGLDARVARHDHPFKVTESDLSDPEVLRSELTDVDAVLSCRPYHRNTRLRGQLVLQ